MSVWIVTGIFLWPLLALIADQMFGQKGSDAVAYAGIGIIGYLYVQTVRTIIRLKREPQFTYNTYRRAESRACEKMHRLFGLYKNDYKYVGAFRDATKLYSQIRERRKREHQKWPMQSYIANTAVVRSLARSMRKDPTPEKCDVIPTIP